MKRLLTLICALLFFSASVGLTQHTAKTTLNTDAADYITQLGSIFTLNDLDIADDLAAFTSAQFFGVSSDETGTGVLVGATSPTFTTSIILGATGVSITDDADGAITFLGLSAGNDEDLTLNFDDVANTVTYSSSTGVISLVYTSMVLTPGGINLSPVIITGSSPYTVLAANTGRLHVITDLGQNTVIDLPAEAAGLFYRFIYADEAVETHDHTIDSENATNFFIGGVAFADTDAGDAADEIHLGIYSDGDSESILTLNNLATGTWVEFHCDGTNWYVNGDIRSDTIPTITDQP